MQPMREARCDNALSKLSKGELPQNCHKRKAPGPKSSPQVLETSNELATHWFLTSWSMPFALAMVRLSCLFQKSGEPSRTRTCDPLVKSQLLYRLSYRPTSRKSGVRCPQSKVSGYRFQVSGSQQAEPGRYPDKVGTLTQPLPKGEEKNCSRY